MRRRKKANIEEEWPHADVFESVVKRSKDFLKAKIPESKSKIPFWIGWAREREEAKEQEKVFLETVSTNAFQNFLKTQICRPISTLSFGSFPVSFSIFPIFQLAASIKLKNKYKQMVEEKKAETKKLEILSYFLKTL